MGYTVFLALCTYGMLLGMSRALKDGDIKLVGGRSSSEGTVLVYHMYRWGAICDFSWDLRDANVACRQLGLVGAIASTSRSRFGQGRRLKWMSYMHCRGNERHLTECRYPGYGRGTRYRFCSGRHTSAGVKCRTPVTTTSSTTIKITTPKTTTKTTTPKPSKIQVRIAGGRQDTDGRLEVLPPGQREYGVICGDQWTFKETIVACKHLGTGYAQQNTSTSVFGGRNMTKYFYSVRCTGKEENLNECQWTEHDGGVRCRRADSVAGIVCANDLPDLEPSTYMVETTAFLQDRSLYYLTCAMEENCLSSSAYDLQRRNPYGWRRSTRRLLRFSSVVRNRGTADFNPTKRRHEWDWHACHMHYHSMEIFAHYDITDQNGNLMAEGLKASFCLEDSECGRGVRPKYNCQNFGQQGISVGCSDNYMADIDCQWIDITDLKPGKYIFKVEINPSLLIAELSYDNNVITCTLAYTGYQARILECKLGSLLG
ncbi:Lysyl oxidase-like 3 [Mizuhopecten yessoensis]|uniref:protein-lysine 6-oxidase n=1 Tax=Mizuhopecten yessoensis TaxID=6573 RepID=A0A210Q9C1_MIZYE|nr:Lysyl oxidase-like 3 [Mizuhopecten yessoensis]